MDRQSILHLLKFGVMGGFLSISYHLSLYIMEKTLLTKLSLMMVVFVIIGGVMVVGGIMFRSYMGGFIDFRKATLSGIVIFSSASLMYLAYTYILYIADPELWQLIRENVAQTTGYILDKTESNSSNIENAVNEIKAVNRPTVWQHLGTYFKMNIIGILMAIVIALFVKREASTP